jgi:hypothetical protein
LSGGSATEVAARFIDGIGQDALLVDDPPGATRPVAQPRRRLPDALARAADADDLVSGDRHLLDLADPAPPVLAPEKKAKPSGVYGDSCRQVLAAGVRQRGHLHSVVVVDRDQTYAVELDMGAPDRIGRHPGPNGQLTYVEWLLRCGTHGDCLKHRTGRGRNP